MENMDTSRMSFLQNVLKYTTSTTANVSGDSNDVKEEIKPREMSPERKEFLQNVLSSKTINPNEEMKKCIRCLYDDNEEFDRQLEALETLRDWCEDINFAIDFHKMDSYKLIPKLIENNNDDFRALSFDFIATLAQNNEYCQKTLIDFKVLPLIFNKIENDKSDNVRVKALYAVSCLIRESNEAQSEFLQSKGCEVIMKTIELPNERFQIKSCFLISSICKNYLIKNEFTKLLLIEKLINMYRQSQLNIHEHVLAAITSLIEDNPDAIIQAKHMNLDFKNIISQRLLIIDNDPSQLEEKENANFLMESLFKN